MTICKTADELEEAKISKAVYLRLKINEESDLESLAQALRAFDYRDSSLCHLILEDCYDEGEDDVIMMVGRQWNEPAAFQLFEAIGSIHNLMHLEFWDLGADDPENTDAAFPVSLITDLLVRSSGRLEHLGFNGVALTGTKLACGAFAQAIENLRCLRCCEFFNNVCLFEDTEVLNIDEVVMAVAKLPMVNAVKLQTYCWHEKGYPLQVESSAPIYALFASSNIQELTLGDFHLGNRGLKDVGKALKKNTSLKKLQIDFAPSCQCTTTEALSVLANALLVNTSLQILKLEFDEACPNLDDFLKQVAVSLTNNTMSSLVKLKVQAPCSYGATVEKVFVQMLETANYTLEKLEILKTEQPDEDDDDDDDDEVDHTYCHYLLGKQKSKIALYLRLNRRGQRKYLLNNIQYVTREKWVDTFSTLTNDLEALHYYLQLNPWLCQKSGVDNNPATKEMVASIARGPNSPNDANPKADGYEQVMEKFQQQLTTCFTKTNDEIQRLNRKHVAEKSHLEEEILRLREENAALKAGKPRS